MFHIFTFISNKSLQLPALMSFRSIHVQNFAKKPFAVTKKSMENVKVFTTHDKQYTVYMHMNALTSVDLLWYTAA